MKDFKKWLFALMSAMMVLGAATACSNASTDPKDTNTEQTDDGTQTDTEDGSETKDNSSESGQ
ncbi:hypothetical protein ACIQXV_11975 [Neobacillus sp. NPDC097160]|uniref:hypothetical protein n=1 Tax=Neobacillus sp. NPDC097160 TaxID=3364298 RepID=UPI003806F66B